VFIYCARVAHALRDRQKMPNAYEDATPQTLAELKEELGIES
jgi:hypothetical protein